MICADCPSSVREALNGRYVCKHPKVKEGKNKVALGSKKAPKWCPLRKKKPSKLPL